jgi:hypothetical protein
MKSTSLIDSQKSQDTKVVTFVIPSLIGNNELDKLRVSLVAGVSNLSEKLHQKLQRLSTMGLTMRKISVRPSKPLETNNINIIIDSIGLSNNLRIIVNISNYFLEKDDEINANISHLVEVTINNNEIGWYNSVSPINAKVYVDNKDDVLSLIEDVLLDIAMYYNYIENINEGDILSGLDFSKKKVEFIIKNKYNSKYGPIHPGSDYISLASLSYNKNSFSYSNYIKLWDNLIKFIYPDIASKSIVMERDEYLIEQLKKHNEYGQLPLKRILKICRDLEAGSYILVRTKKNPSTNIKKSQMIPFFKGPSKFNYLKNKVRTHYKKKENAWRLGKVNILPFSDYTKVDKYSEWISIFPLTIN